MESDIKIGLVLMAQVLVEGSVSSAASLFSDFSSFSILSSLLYHFILNVHFDRLNWFTFICIFLAP